MRDDSLVFRPKAARPAPAQTVGVVGWLRANLFSGPGNTLLTVVGAYLAWVVLSSVAEWAVFNAVWEAESRRECLEQVGRAGACWPGVFAWFDNLIYGLYPKDQVWRINLGFLLLVAWVVPLWLERVRSKLAIGLTAVLLYPFLASYFFLGGDKGLLWSALIALGLGAFGWVWATALVERRTGFTLGEFVLRRAGALDADPRHQRRVLFYSGAAGWLVAYALVWLWDLRYVGTNDWGGLFLTLVISG
jgi:general L-amino acid transport system permease protein